MKFLSKLFVVILFFSTSYASYAQKTLEQGTVKMEITKADSDDPNMAMGLQAMNGSQTLVVFDGNKHVSVMDMMGGMIKIKVLVEKESNKMNMIFDMMGNKTWVESELDKAQSEKEKTVAAQTKIEVDKNTTKEILGYKCYKITMTNPEMDGLSIEAYVTEDIKTKANLIQGFQSVELPGFTMEFNVINPQMRMTMSAVEVSEKADPKLFELDTKGCKKMTMEEFQKSMAAMGGGF